MSPNHPLHWNKFHPHWSSDLRLHSQLFAASSPFGWPYITISTTVSFARVHIFAILLHLILFSFQVWMHLMRSDATHFNWTTCNNQSSQSIVQRSGPRIFLPPTMQWVFILPPCHLEIAILFASRDLVACLCVLSLDILKTLFRPRVFPQNL